VVQTFACKTMEPAEIKSSISTNVSQNVKFVIALATASLNSAHPVYAASYRVYVHTSRKTK